VTTSDFAFSATENQSLTLWEKAKNRVFTPWRGRITLSRGTQDQCDPTRIRPFQGRVWLGARFPGALPPATLLIPSGDQGSKPVLRSVASGSIVGFGHWL
jgi:hypothetical protein